jgi:hypothetical protein
MITATCTLIRKSLHRQIMEAAAAQGKVFSTSVSGLNCLNYELDGKVMTPGEMADALGIIWP